MRMRPALTASRLDANMGSPDAYPWVVNLAPDFIAGRQGRDKAGDFSRLERGGGRRREKHSLV